MHKQKMMYPFGSMDEILKSEKTVPYVKDFLKDYAMNEKIPKMEAEFNDSLSTIKEYNDKKLIKLNNRLKKQESIKDELFKDTLDAKSSQRKKNENLVELRSLSDDITKIKERIEYRKNSKIEDLLDTEPGILSDKIFDRASNFGDKTSKNIKNIKIRNDAK